MEEKLPNTGQIELLNKYLTGEISDTEITDAEKLISTDEACKKYWNNILFLNESTIAPGMAKNFDPVKAFAKFAGHTEKKANSTNKKLYLNLLKIAAVILITFGIWRVNYYYSKEKLHTLKSSEKRDIAFTLADGSVIELNKNSTLKYPKNFKKNTREIEFEGEAYFRITDMPEKPFIIG